MNSTPAPQWHWEKTDVRRSGSSGDISKLFKNEETKHPAVLAIGAPHPSATLMAREVIQNSWDAARELRDDLGDSAPDFEIDFRFAELQGDEKATLAQNLNLGGLATHLAEVDAAGAQGKTSRAKVGLGPSNALDNLGSETPLRILTITERGTTGMYGPFTEANSKLYLALISIGYTMKAAGSGGSYGYGKAGLIAGSATRTVVAYTCFREREDDPGVTRRLIGMTYWGQHGVSSGTFTGFARFGRFEDDWAQPFENEEADRVAESLGLEPRDPRRPTDLGTTFLLLDPDIDPKDLSTAIGRNWWPAILEDSFHPTVHVRDASGAVGRLDIRPKKDPLLQTFIRGYELATTSQDNAVNTDYRKDLKKSTAATGSLDLGWIGLSANLGSWSYLQTDADDDDENQGNNVRHASLVALLRGPRMVVEYLPCALGRLPFVRGVFIADNAIDDLLRQTEPKAHDSWQTTTAEEGVDARSPLIADQVLKKVRESVREFQKRLKPPPPDPGDIRLPIFQDLFKSLLQGKGSSIQPPPPKGDREATIHIKNQKLDVTNDGRLQYRVNVETALSPHFKQADSAEVTIRLAYKFIEDGSARQKCALAVSVPSGFKETEDGVYVGVLNRQSSRFEVKSEPYNPDWSGRFTATCVINKPATGDVANAAVGTEVDA